MKTLLTFALVCLVLTTSAQETWWMRPDQFRYEFGDTCKIFFQTGEQLIGEYVNLKKEEIGKVTSLVNGQQEDLTSFLKMGVAATGIVFALNSAS